MPSPRRLLMLSLAARARPWTLLTRAMSAAPTATQRWRPPEATAGLVALGGKLGHDFADISLLETAVTHPSTMLVSSDRFERLEFLGDRVLGLALAEWLEETFPDDSEGMAQVRHARLIQKEALVQVGTGLGLEAHLRTQLANNRTSAGVVADAVEALVAAVFRDAGYDAASAFVRRAWGPLLRAMATEPPPERDAKSRLGEVANRLKRPAPVYESSREGPDHAPTFSVRCSFGGHTATAEGPRKRHAQTAAAARVLELMGDEADG
mmetsp:Transcript_26424/g.79242  ORF Transcript_26424/g.79242 Transcript_26424/m.79242 type:complete len:266 (+) Transcript_26424:163-960(+)